MTTISAFLRDEGLFARAMRSSAWTAFGFFASQAVRFASNLILTRLLFPEAFGMMALVTVAMVGLGNFSDMGTAPAIAYNKRGDDADFLDTAWTLHVVRGVLLWLATCALALPFARLYGEPMLAQFLPVAGLSFLIGGFFPTRLESAQRHLKLARVVQIDLLSQLASTILIVALAWWTGSIWSLVVGAVFANVVKFALIPLMLPGPCNRFRWEPVARHELVHFGKWIFLSTVCGFLVAQGDRLILGKYLSLDLLGIYNLGYFLASFPLLLAGAVTGRVLIPLYRDCPPTASAANFQKLQLMRFALSGGVVTLLLLMAFVGVPLVELLYDPRFHAAGPIVVLLACAQIPQAIVMTYDQASLAAGDSRRFFFLMAPRALAQTAFILAGVKIAGIAGALVGIGVATLATYPLYARLARRYGAWDPRHDALFGALALAFGGLAIWLNRDALAGLGGLG
jgi:O-antigen/teichoic acid export membrane protein